MYCSNGSTSYCQFRYYQGTLLFIHPLHLLSISFIILWFFINQLNNHLMSCYNVLLGISGKLLRRLVVYFCSLPSLPRDSPNMFNDPRSSFISRFKEVSINQSITQLLNYSAKYSSPLPLLLLPLHGLGGNWKNWLKWKRENLVSQKTNNSIYKYNSSIVSFVLKSITNSIYLIFYHKINKPICNITNLSSSSLLSSSIFSSLLPTSVDNSLSTMMNLQIIFSLFINS